MAMILEQFVSRLGKMLSQIAIDEVEMLLGVPGEIQKPRVTLLDLRNVLADAERRRITDHAVQAWVKELKDAMYDVDDILDLCHIEAANNDIRNPDSLDCWSCACSFRAMASCLRNPVRAHEVGSRIKGLNQKLDTIMERKGRFNFNLSSYEPHRQVVSHVSRKTGSTIVQSDIVGEKIEENTRRIVEVLTKKDHRDNVLVVAIVGAGGIGKTTLAKKIFNDQKVQDEFEKKIWVCITQEFNEVDLLKTVIRHAGGDHGGETEKSLLEPMLTGMVRGKKFLMVMDDIWSDEAWNALLRVPMKDGADGSRILITTRNGGVARQMKAVHVHRAEKLESQDGWSLLKKQVVLCDDEILIESLKDIGEAIVELCGGLPLAIKAIGGLLREKNGSRNEWERVLKSSAWSIAGLDDEVNAAIYLSYEDLPCHLKQCLLYCSLFPKDQTIHRWNVVKMWIAEGFILDDGKSTLLEDIGTDYYHELVMRNLLEPIANDYDQEECKMHDVVRSLANFLAKDECSILGEEQNLKIGTHRLCISGEEVELNVLKKQESLRTLMLFGGMKVKLDDFVNHLSCLRVLYMDGATTVSFPDSLCRLKHLRYLNIGDTAISTIPKDIGDLKYLQYFRVAYCRNLTSLPESIMRLGELRTLDTFMSTIEAFPRGLMNLKKLVRLAGFRIHSGTDYYSSLEELGPLSNLRELFVERIEEATSSSAAGARLCDKLQLRELWLSSRKLKNSGAGLVEDDTDDDAKQHVEECFDKLCPPYCLEMLTICGYSGRRLPRWLMSSLDTMVLENLRLLELRDCACEQLPAGLGLLPNLNTIWIRRALLIQCIGHEFVLLERKPRPSQVVAFPKLESLELTELRRWEQWEWKQDLEQATMPSLRLLVIENCKLKSLPPGLAHQATALTDMRIYDVNNLEVVEHFHSLHTLRVHRNHNLERLSNLPGLQQLNILGCPKLKVLENLTGLECIKLEDCSMETLPEYLRQANIKKLEIDCSSGLLQQLVCLRDAGSEWDKIKHIEQVKVFGHDGDGERKWHAFYTKEPYSFTTNISSN